MKTFNDLSEQQQKLAVKKEVDSLLEDILSGLLRFNDKLNEDDFQARIDAALQKAEDMRTPWFAGEYLMDDPVIKETVIGMAQCSAEDAIYLEPGEHSQRVPAEQSAKFQEV